MNPYSETNQDLFPSEDDDTLSSICCSTSDSNSSVSTSPLPQIYTGESFPPASHRLSVSDLNWLDQNVHPPSSYLPLPAFTPAFTPSWGLTQDSWSLPIPNPYLSFDDNPPHKVSVDVQTPDLHPSPQVKGAVERSRQRNRTSVTSLGQTNRKQNVGLPTSTTQGGETHSTNRIVLWLKRCPVCRTTLICCVVIAVIVVTAAIISLLSYRK